MNMKKSLLRRNPHVTRLSVVIVVWLVFIALTRFERFYTLLNFQTMASQFPEFGLMALGVMLCMIAGGIDLSTVAVANLTNILGAMLLKNLAVGGELPGYAIPLVFVMSMALGAVLGAFNGVLVSKVRIPPILATLGSSELFTGIAIVITNGKSISGLPLAYSGTINQVVLGLVPVQLLIFAAAALVIWFLLNHTTYGVKLYMLGTNPTAARYSGLKNDRLLIKTHLISGVTAALGGLVMLANYNSARADYGSVYVLQCVLIVVLGGVSPSGGKGKIGGVILAIVLLRLLETGINRFPQISSYYISLIWGAVLLLVMVMDYFSVYRDPTGKRRRVGAS